ncbi:MAG: substrate-binding domain-containing protein [Desulfuromusa sp.]
MYMQKIAADPDCTTVNDIISFSCTPTFSTAFLAQILLGFRHKSSGVLQYHFCTEMPDKIRTQLRHDHLDLAVIEHCTGFDLNGFKTVHLPDDELVFVSADLTILEQIDHVRELFRYSLLCSCIGCCSRIILEDSLTQQNVSFAQFKSVIECSDLGMLLQSLLSGVGVAFMPRVLINSYLKNGQLKEFNVRDFKYSRKRTLAFRPFANKDNSAKAFADRIVEYFNV